jgi:tripartite-type tricarboxylate transporter receptor subunit TctC
MGADMVRPDSQNLTRRNFVLLSGAALLARTLPATAAELQATRVRFLIGSFLTYADYSRLFMRYFSPLFPNTRTDVESVPEADGRLAAKRIFESKADPIEIGMFETSLLYAAMLGEDTSGYDFAKFHWLGKLATDPRLLIVTKDSGIKSLSDLQARKEPVIVPTSSMTSRSTVEVLILNALLDLPLKPVPGFTGGSERMLALMNGEGQALASSYPGLRTLVEEEGAIPILRLTNFVLPTVDENVPLLRDVAPKPVSPIVDLIELSGQLGRPIAAPPNIAADELAALREGFNRVVGDPAFIAEAAKLKLPIDPAPGAEVEDKIVALFGRKEQVGVDLTTLTTCGQKRADGIAC